MGSQTSFIFPAPARAGSRRYPGPGRPLGRRHVPVLSTARRSSLTSTAMRGFWRFHSHDLAPRTLGVGGARRGISRTVSPAERPPEQARRGRGNRAALAALGAGDSIATGSCSSASRWETAWPHRMARPGSGARAVSHLAAHSVPDVARLRSLPSGEPPWRHRSITRRRPRVSPCPS